MANKITFFRGDTPLITVPITVAGGVPSGDPSTYTAYFTLTSNGDPTSDSDAAIQKSVTPVAHSSNWTASFQLLNTDTQNLDPNSTYYFDVQLKDGSGYITTLVSGVCIIKTDYTRRTS
jgi:hypothetical protein